MGITNWLHDNNPCTNLRPTKSLGEASLFIKSMNNDIFEKVLKAPIQGLFL